MMFNPENTVLRPPVLSSLLVKRGFEDDAGGSPPAGGNTFQSFAGGQGIYTVPLNLGVVDSVILGFYWRWLQTGALEDVAIVSITLGGVALPLGQRGHVEGGDAVGCALAVARLDQFAPGSIDCVITFGVDVPTEMFALATQVVSGNFNSTQSGGGDTTITQADGDMLTSSNATDTPGTLFVMCSIMDTDVISLTAPEPWLPGDTITTLGRNDAPADGGDITRCALAYEIVAASGEVVRVGATNSVPLDVAAVGTLVIFPFAPVV